MSQPHHILAIGAHPDDIELGCGGSLAKLSRNGAQVHALILCRGAQGAPADVDRAGESRRALAMLGVTRLTQLDFTDTAFPGEVREITAALEAAMIEPLPDRVYTMSPHDRHQDHRAVYEASIVAFRGVSQVLCYETPSSLPRFMPDLYEDISAELDVKLKALRAHDSQQHREYMKEAQLRCLAQFRGQQVGLSACEGFASYRMVL